VKNVAASTRNIRTGENIEGGEHIAGGKSEYRTLTFDYLTRKVIFQKDRPGERRCVRPEMRGKGPYLALGATSGGSTLLDTGLGKDGEEESLPIENEEPVAGEVSRGGAEV